jgi:hypothetical protein
MSGSASQGLEQALLQHTLGITPMPAPARVYVALCGTLPTEAAGGIEVSGGGYARVAATFSMLTASIASNATSVEFPAATLAIGTIPWAPGAAVFGGHIRRVGYWSRVLTDAEMQQITANP